MTSPLDRCSFIPVVVIDDLDHAVPLAQALSRGGVGIIEVTLRSPAALDALSAIASEVPEVLVGAGTVTDARHAATAAAAGAKFLVSPGCAPRQLDAMLETGVSVVPGVQTASEVLTACERGLRDLKFFPAEAAGGPAVLKALNGPFPDVRFCATGGITAQSAPEYLALPNVVCVGGSWLTPRAVVSARDWSAVEQLAREATARGVRK